MIDPALVTAFRDVFKARPIDVRVDNCLNRRHKDAGCRRCADACPTQAITLTGVNPGLEDAQCVNCGACLRVCPTDVFVLARTPESELLSTHIELSLEPVGTICPVHQSPEQSHMPVQKVLRHKRCLAGFSTEQLMALAANGQRDVWLDDSYCERCPIGHAHLTLVEMAVAANQLLAALGRTAAIHMAQGHASSLTPEPHDVRVLESGQPELSRRGLFKMLGGRVRQQAADVLDYRPERKPAGPVPVDQRLPHRLPASRRRLNARLAELAEGNWSAEDATIPTAAIPYGAVIIAEDRCTACELCARFCPTGALRFNRIEAQADGAHPAFELSFRANLCLDCDICVAACPERAIRYGDQLAPAALDGREETLARGRLTACTACDAAMAMRPHEPRTLCYVCRQGASRVNPMADTAGLMADLLKRTL